MKLNRLESTTQHNTGESVAPARPLPGERVRRVEAASGLEGDRQRSLQQEIGEFDPQAIGPFAGAAQVLEDAHAMAVQLAALGTAADALIKVTSTSAAFAKVDDKV